MSDYPKVSIVILSYNRLPDLRETIEYCRTYTYPELELIIVDNLSTDGSIDYINSLEKRFGKIILKQNTGSAEGHSVGMRAAIGQYVITMDDDAFVEDQAIYEMVKLFETHPKLAVISFNCINYYTEYEPGVEKTSTQDYSRDEIDESYELFTESSAGFRKDVLEQVGYHQNEYFYGGEDTELSMRILAHSHNIKIAPNLISYHKITDTYRDTTMLTTNSVRNSFWMIIQYFPLEVLPFHVLRYIWYLSMALVQKRKTLYLTSWLDAVFQLKTMRRRRRPLPSAIFKKIIFPYTRAFQW